MVEQVSTQEKFKLCAQGDGDFLTIEIGRFADSAVSAAGNINPNVA